MKPKCRSYGAKGLSDLASNRLDYVQLTAAPVSITLSSEQPDYFKLRLFSTCALIKFAYGMVVHVFRKGTYINMFL